MLTNGSPIVYEVVNFYYFASYPLRIFSITAGGYAKLRGDDWGGMGSNLGKATKLPNRISACYLTEQNEASICEANPQSRN